MEAVQLTADGDYGDAFAFLERDARRYNKAFTEEEEARRG